MKRFLQLLIVAIMCLSLFAVFSLTACNETVPAEEEVAEEEATEVEAEEENIENEEETVEEEVIEPATVTFWHTYNLESVEYITLRDVIVPNFEAQYPNITVVEQQIPHEDLHAKLVTSVAGEEVPDIVRMDIIWVPEFAEMGALAPLDGYDTFSSLAENVFPGPLNTCKWGDNYYGVPLTTNTRVLFWNRSMFEEAGIAEPPKTWDEFADAAQKLTNSGETWGIAIGDCSPWNFLPWIWSGGGDVTDEGITTATGYINGESSVNAVQFIVDLYNDGFMSDSIIGGGIGTHDGYAQNIYGMFTGGPWFYPMISGQFPDAEIDTSLWPAGNGGSISVIGGEDLVIFDGSENKDAAYLFAEFMVSEETQLIMSETGQIPVLKSVADSEYIKNHEFYPLYMEQLKTAKARTVHPGWQRMDDAIKLGIEEAINGVKPVQEALDDVAIKINEIIEEYN
jgi:multiple sugar transport system substrate-binding protein